MAAVPSGNSTSRVGCPRKRLTYSEGSDVPAEFSRPEVLEILREYYAGLDEKVEVKLTGHSAR